MRYFTGLFTLLALLAGCQQAPDLSAYAQLGQQYDVHIERDVRGLEDDGFHTNVAGDGLYYLVSWDSSGMQSVRGVHQYGSATLDSDSPHYSDQAEDYANEVLHDPLFDDELRAASTVQRYRPGEMRP